MKKLLCLGCLFLYTQSFGWGLTGHRVVGEIATYYLSPKAKKNLQKILGDTSLAVVSNWMDEIRSNPAYEYANDWHWVTLPDGVSYESVEKNPDGDIIQIIQRLVNELKTGDLPLAKESEHLKMLVHLVGDIHQPLHVGTGEDQGGNQMEVEFFWEDSNLHRVWDSDMIDSKKYSYTELAAAINHPSKAQIQAWQSSTVEVWADESRKLRQQVYALPEDREIGYEYVYHNWSTVEQRLLQAGIRLAGLLNEIYG